MLDTDLDENDWDGLIKDFKNVVKEKTKKQFPQDVYEQLFGAISAVFLSWESNRAKVYRKLNHIPSAWGTAVNVQSMVFGNLIFFVSLDLKLKIYFFIKFLFLKN